MNPSETTISPRHFNEANILFHWNRLLGIIRTHQQVQSGSSAPAYPITVEINPMDYCNHGCVWCFTRSYRETDRMPENMLRRLLHDLSVGGVTSIHFAGGGESTLHKGLFRTASVGPSQSSEPHDLPGPLIQGLITNGSMLGSLDLNALVARFSWIRFSIDAGSEARYREKHRAKGHDLRQLIDWIKCLVEARAGSVTPAIGASFIFERNDQEVLAEVLLFAQRMKLAGVDYLQIKPENGNRGPAAYEFLEQLKAPLTEVFDSSPVFATLNTPHVQEDNASYCWYSYVGPVVGATGDVYVCCYTYGQDQFRYGNIGNAGFESLWTSDSRRLVAASVVPRECTSCRHNRFNLLMERMASLPEELLDQVTATMNTIMEDGQYEGVLPNELLWLDPMFRHCLSVVQNGYHEMLAFPVYRQTEFVVGTAL